MSRTVVVGSAPLRVEDVVLTAQGQTRVVLSESAALRARLAASRDSLIARLERGERVYGVTTGFGESCETDVPRHLLAALSHHLVRFHGCGTGRYLTEDEALAVVTVRLASLATGWSAVRSEVLEALASLVNARIAPRIPSEGSVGASGDLTPLSYVAATLLGERDVTVDGRVMPAMQALKDAGLAALQLEPKESLALMNGTGVMAGLGCLAFSRSERLWRLAALATGMAVEALRGRVAHFDDRIFRAKPHPGQRAAAALVRETLGDYHPPAAARLQDRYSLRCAPHVIGVLADLLPWARSILEVEINGANDNPLIDPETGDILHGGNFYGGHVCAALDAMKPAIAGLADLLDRQLVLLCSPETSNGLPANLTGATGEERLAHHGFKAMQITASALAAEAAKASVPASIFSRSTESHNQDKVSLGTIAARDALRVCELTETVVAIHLLATCQALELRGGAVGPGARHTLAAVRSVSAPVETDRELDEDIARVLGLLRAGTLDAVAESSAR